MIDLSVNLYIESLSFLLNYKKKIMLVVRWRIEKINPKEYPKLPEIINEFSARIEDFLIEK